MRGWRLLLFALLLSAPGAFGQDPPLTRIAFGSCNREYQPQVLWSPILECKPELWIWLGDIVYARSDDLPDLARRYHAAKAQPDYTALRSQCRILGVWDDNDYGVSNGGSENPHKVESQKLLLDFLDEPAESPRRAQTGVYAAYTFGPLGKQVKVILLDSRYFREPEPHWWRWRRPAPAPDILGPQQWAWLEQALTGSTADIHLIGSAIQVIASEHRFEKWADFPAARQRLFDLIAKTKARNVIFLSGDRHLGEISRATDPRIAQSLYDITSSGLTHHVTNGFFLDFASEPNRFRLGRNYREQNFGLLEIDWDSSPPSVTAQIRGAGNVVALEEKITLTPATTPIGQSTLTERK